jgi:hypothetical protein
LLTALLTTLCCHAHCMTIGAALTSGGAAWARAESTEERSASFARRPSGRGPAFAEETDETRGGRKQRRGMGTGAREMCISMRRHASHTTELICITDKDGATVQLKKPTH